MYVEKVAMEFEIYSLNTGVYIKENSTQVDVENFDPEHQTDLFEIEFKIYFIQLFVWSVVVCVAKLILYLIQMILAPVLEAFAELLIGWLSSFPNLKLVIIMILVPFILNSIQFWIQDNILKANKKSNLEFVSHARMKRSLTMKPVRYPRMVSGKNTVRSGSLVSSQKPAFDI